jgi:TonB family protein
MSETWYSILAGAAFKGSVVLAVAWAPALLLRRYSAAARHLVWTVALAAVLALPFLSFSLPALRVTRLAALVPALPDMVFQVSASEVPAASTVVPGAAATKVAPPPNGSGHDWRLWLMMIWATGAAVACLPMLVGWEAMRSARRTAKPFSDRHLCGLSLRTLGIRRRVDILETTAGSMPVSFGILRPAVLVPSGMPGWGDERCRAVLLHELAHVHRGDAASHLVGRAALVLHWWNPLAWLAWRELLKERERAADDFVLSAGVRASDYAGHLLEIARAMHSAGLGYVAVAMVRRSQLEGRVLAILDSRVSRKAPGRGSIAATALLAAGLIAPLAAVRAQNAQPRTIQDVNTAIQAARAQKNYQMLEDAAKSAEQLQKFDAARELLEAALAIRAERSGAQDLEYGAGLLKLADLEWRRGGKDAADLYANAAQVLGDRPEAARALTYVGLTALKKKDYAAAFDSFQQAQGVDPAHAGTALMWMAVVRDREQDAGDAERLFQSALAVQNPKSIDAAVTMEVYSQVLRRQGRDAEASEFDTRAATIQKRGTPEPVPSGVFSTRTPGVTPPSVLRKLEPEYSEEAHAARLQGTVVLTVVVEPDGVARNVLVARGLGLGLDEKALEAISHWQFKPGTKDGLAVPVAATIEVNWRLL